MEELHNGFREANNTYTEWYPQITQRLIVNPNNVQLDRGMLPLAGRLQALENVTYRSCRMCWRGEVREEDVHYVGQAFANLGLDPPQLGDSDEEEQEGEGQGERQGEGHDDMARDTDGHMGDDMPDESPT